MEVIDYIYEYIYIVWLCVGTMYMRLVRSHRNPSRHMCVLTSNEVLCELSVCARGPATQPNKLRRDMVTVARPLQFGSVKGVWAKKRGLRASAQWLLLSSRCFARFSVAFPRTLAWNVTPYDLGDGIHDGRDTRDVWTQTHTHRRALDEVFAIARALLIRPCTPIASIRGKYGL